jgi:hypothetical protein
VGCLTFFPGVSRERAGEEQKLHGEKCTEWNIKFPGRSAPSRQPDRGSFFRVSQFELNSIILYIHLDYYSVAVEMESFVRGHPEEVPTPWLDRQLAADRSSPRKKRGTVGYAGSNCCFGCGLAVVFAKIQA